MKQVLARKGKPFVDEIPAPHISDNAMLVQVYNSCISAGTEMSMLSDSGATFIQKLLSHPEKIIKAMDIIKSGRINKIFEKVTNRAQDNVQLGYSAAGVVLEVGKNIKGFQKGDRVACAGTGVANHAEFIEVPENLAVKMPVHVDFQEASTVALGAIALQGIRRANVKLGEFVAVIGLGSIGQIAIQLLKAQGCRVIGIEVDQCRLEKALALGLEKGVNPSQEDAVAAANTFSQGYGVDSVLITTTTTAKEPLAQAFHMCRKKGKVVLIGTAGLELNRDDMYKKELDFLISTSYGPGRYDEEYEHKGVKYPYAYVRWTETKNMEAYLELLGNKTIPVSALIDKCFRIAEAPLAYDELKKTENKPLIVLFEYNRSAPSVISKKTDIHVPAKNDSTRINIALIGAGDFAQTMILPNLMKLKKHYNLCAIVSKTGSNAKTLAKNFNAGYASTDYKTVLSDTSIDAVLIATRHNLHASLAIEALEAGKAVFLEKPMALDEEELKRLVHTIESSKSKFMVDFNRRFSPYATMVKKSIEKHEDPLIVEYQMNAGFLPLEHWSHGEEGGGRIIGEACHIFDLFNYFTDAKIESISIDRITPHTKRYSNKDNAVITLKYDEGSICTLLYTALGNAEHPKEICTVYFDGNIITITDYKKLDGYGIRLPKMQSREPEKGHREALMRFAQHIQGNTQPPIPLWQLTQATEISFEVEKI